MQCRLIVGNIFVPMSYLIQEFRSKLPVSSMLTLLFIPGFFLFAATPGLIRNSYAESADSGRVKAVWDPAKAYREKTSTRERICINGLWRWQPAKSDTDAVPADGWGYFKVPGSWPGITTYMQKESQTVHRHPGWEQESLGRVTAAWHQREITVPGEWEGRRIAVSVEYLNSYAEVYVDGKRAGEIRFPGGEVDLTPVCSPGNKYLLSMFVAALPLKAVMLSYSDTASAREVKGSVTRRGLCGDVYLVGEPSGPRIVDAKVDTSVRKGEISFGAALHGLVAGEEYTLRAKIVDRGRSVREFTGRSFRRGDLENGRIAFTAKWIPENLWDVHTPQNVFELQLSLLGVGGKLLDTYHEVRFGFREFWIEGRDFFLNGSRIFLSAVPLDNAQAGAGLANYEAAKESLLRLKSFGINFVYTHNYGCEPGSHLSFAEILRAADDVGMLISFSQPHFGHYEWQSPDADRSNGYAGHAEFYVRAAQNHPSVVMYSMSHNATGYSEDMNPDMIDGVSDPRDRRSLKNAKLALRAEAVVKRLDPGSIIYHHSSGNLGSMHTSNFYPNFAPIQELSDWFEHWATRGVKPVFTCEYGAPLTWDWTMYRGWYKGKREFGGAKVPWEFCLAEWNSQFLGDRAFEISEMEKANLRWEAEQFRAGNLWQRFDYPYRLDSREFDERYPVFARYLTDNWRAFRTWGVSAISPWIHMFFWKPQDGVERTRKEFKVDWEDLQRPGFSPDYIEERYERMDMAFERPDWIETDAARALIRNNLPLLAYIGGKPGRFTSKDHNFFAGETVEKQIVIINNSRETVSGDCEWSLELPAAVTGTAKVSIKAGEQERFPLRFDLPGSLSPGAYTLSIKVRFNTGETQDDSFVINVLAEDRPRKQSERIALFDPQGETGQVLKDLGVQCEAVKAGADLSSFEILIIGKGALTAKGHAPDVERVRDGLKVMVFEQTSDVLEKRFGFRATEYGLRQVFFRIPDHPLLAGIEKEHLRDWRGEATITPPRLEYEPSRRYDGAPSVRWCGIEVTRAWRCGNRGNVASVLIEKPARGDFLPVVDGGFSLQYSPLMEYREGRGMVLFCQMDVTGRTETDPAAARLVRNIIQYVSGWKPPKTREALYAGDGLGKSHLELAGIRTAALGNGPVGTDHVLIVSPGGGDELADRSEAIKDWLKAGGNLLAIGLNEEEANPFLPEKVSMKRGEHISAFFEAAGRDSLFAGIGPADIHNRDPGDLDLVSAGASTIGNGVLARADGANAVFCQLVPWQFDHNKQNTKRTYRRGSFLVSRLLANMGVGGTTPLLQRFRKPAAKWEKRWLTGLYLDSPEEWDDPYRFFRW
jgi:beta-galactosidase